MTDTNSASDGQTLHVYVGEADKLREQTKDRLRAIDAGEEPKEVGETYVLNFESEADLGRLLSPANLELLRAIRQEEPESMRATADIVGRDFKEVHRNLTELHELGVIEFVTGGRSKRPVAEYDDIEVHYSLQPDEASTEQAGA